MKKFKAVFRAMWATLKYMAMVAAAAAAFTGLLFGITELIMYSKVWTGILLFLVFLGLGTFVNYKVPNDS